MSHVTELCPNKCHIHKVSFVTGSSHKTCPGCFFDKQVFIRLGNRSGSRQKEHLGIENSSCIYFHPAHESMENRHGGSDVNDDDDVDDDGNVDEECACKFVWIYIACLSLFK